MSILSPTGAEILDTHTNGVVTGHPAAMARLIADELVHERWTNGIRVRTITTDGLAALEQWRTEQPTATHRPQPPQVHLTLSGKPHQAVLAAAADRDHKVPMTFNARTRRVLHQRGLAALRPFVVGGRTFSYDELRDPAIHLTPAGRAYAEQHGVPTPRRTVVLVSCVDRKRDRGVNEYGRLNGLPAGELCNGQYHASLRSAATALTCERGTTYIVSALHGIVGLDRNLQPYDAWATRTP